jgi:anti-sigma factor RsiW
MTDHLSPALLSALADGELSAEELATAKKHMDTCLLCASGAIDEWLLKSAVAKSGRRYEVPVEFHDRMAKLISQQSSLEEKRSSGAIPSSALGRRPWVAFSGWATAAVLLLALTSGAIVQFRNHQSGAVLTERAALVTEACDLHIATLAAAQQPQVVSSDRHTVKPWFQGKLPFSFNLPETLPDGATLDGANLTYLHNQPVAQLLFSIGRHRASVFVAERNGSNALADLQTAHSGFQLTSFTTDELAVIAVSDVDPGRLAALASSLKAAQIRP